MVEKGTKGFSFGKKEDKMGIRASATRELHFEDCRVPVENLLAKEGTGFITAMKTFDASRPGVGAQALGIAQGALDEVDAAVGARRARVVLHHHGLPAGALDERGVHVAAVGGQVGEGQVAGAGDHAQDRRDRAQFHHHVYLDAGVAEQVERPTKMPDQLRELESRLQAQLKKLERQKSEKIIDARC